MVWCPAFICGNIFGREADLSADMTPLEPATIDLPIDGCPANFPAIHQIGDGVERLAFGGAFCRGVHAASSMGRRRRRPILEHWRLRCWARRSCDQCSTR